MQRFNVLKYAKLRFCGAAYLYATNIRRRSCCTRVQNRSSAKHRRDLDEDVIKVYWTIGKSNANFYDKSFTRHAHTIFAVIEPSIQRKDRASESSYRIILHIVCGWWRMWYYMYILLCVRVKSIFGERDLEVG